MTASSVSPTTPGAFALAGPPAWNVLPQIWAQPAQPQPSELGLDVSSSETLLLTIHSNALSSSPYVHHPVYFPHSTHHTLDLCAWGCVHACVCACLLHRSLMKVGMRCVLTGHGQAQEMHAEVHKYLLNEHINKGQAELLELNGGWDPSPFKAYHSPF